MWKTAECDSLQCCFPAVGAAAAVAVSILSAAVAISLSFAAMESGWQLPRRIFVFWFTSETSFSSPASTLSLLSTGRSQFEPVHLMQYLRMLIITVEASFCLSLSLSLALSPQSNKLKEFWCFCWIWYSL